MVDVTDIQGTGEQFISNATNFMWNMAIVILIAIVIIAICAAALYLYVKWKKFTQFECRIFEIDALGQKQHSTDRAGIFKKWKTNNQLFYMKKARIGIKPENIKYIKDGKKKIVYMQKISDKDYRILNFKITNEGIKTELSEEDMNWAIDTYQESQKAFLPNILLQYMPYITVIATLVIIAIIMIPFIKNFDVLKEVAVVLKQVAVELKQAAMAQGGTVIID